MDAWDPNNRMIKNLMGLSGGVWLGGMGNFPRLTAIHQLVVWLTFCQKSRICDRQKIM